VPVSSTAVRARDLVLGYRTGVALGPSSFDIPAGRVTAVIGPNGSGKSTLLSAIAGLLEPIGGTLEVAAANGDASRIAYVLQTTKVNEALPITVREVVAMGRYSGAGWYRRLGPADREAVADAMARTGIATLRGHQLHHLSGGQRQRAYMAQGLAQDHDLLLLDEPLTGIDLPAAKAIDRVIHEETSRGCTVVLTTHDLTEARAADHAILLAGAVVAEGPPAGVLSARNLVRAYGSALLHLDERAAVVLDDAAHRPVGGRHVHRSTEDTATAPPDAGSTSPRPE
jgi:manganese transport system ATP-binding protein